MADEQTNKFRDTTNTAAGCLKNGPTAVNSGIQPEFMLHYSVSTFQLDSAAAERNKPQNASNKTGK